MRSLCLIYSPPCFIANSMASLWAKTSLTFFRDTMIGKGVSFIKVITSKGLPLFLPFFGSYLSSLISMHVLFKHYGPVDRTHLRYFHLPLPSIKDTAITSSDLPLELSINFSNLKSCHPSD